MNIERIRLKNFKVFQNATIDNIPNFCTIVGANGTGKSTLFDVFGFLRDCLMYNVTHALQRRGGFHEVVSRNHEHENIEIEIQYRFQATDKDRLATYLLEIGLQNKKPSVVRELIQFERGAHGKPYPFLKFEHGIGEIVTYEKDDFNNTDGDPDIAKQVMEASDILAIKGIGQFQNFKAANTLRRMIENWHVFDFRIEAARGAKDVTGENQHLSFSGDNLQQVSRNLFENHPEVYEQILEAMRRHVPGVKNITTLVTKDRRLILQFDSGIFKDPFIDRYVSDGTLKMFAFLVLLHDPTPHPFLCVEEPENHLYQDLLEELAEEFRSYANRGGQVMVSTHSPDFLDGTEVNEVFWLEKGPDGFSQIHRANNDTQVVAYMEDGDKMGNLWRLGLLGNVNLRNCQEIRITADSSESCGIFWLDVLRSEKCPRR